MGMYFSLSLGLGRAIGLTEAMELFGLERSGRVHSGIDDAVDTARLWAAMAARTRGMLLSPLREEDSDNDDGFRLNP
jgi:inhibitor of KinA sporulation pathway (predicted exonuclease)